MKLSNFALSIVASLALGAAVSSSIYIVPTQSTAVISVPAEEGVKGGGLTVVVPKNMTHRQAELLGLAYDIAKRDGHKYPQLLQGIILQESQAGEHESYKVAGQEYGLKTNQRYYGVAQIKLDAAKDVLNRYPQLREQFSLQTGADEEVIAKLIENDRFNLAIASKYLLVLKSYGYDTIRQLALAYNQGPGGAKSYDASTHHYANGVVKYIQMITPDKKL
jgi:hypothetical protein